MQWQTTLQTLEAFFEMDLGWLTPVVLALFSLGLLLAFLSKVGILAPFVYPLL